jgi:LysM repeat protein
MNNLSGEYSDFVAIPLNSSYREEVSGNQSLEEANHLTEIFQQQTQPLAEEPKKTKFTQPVVMTPQEAGDEAEAIKRDFEELEDVFDIFDIENRMRVLLEQDFSAKEECQILYEQKILPLMAQIKGTITQHHIHFAAQAAASKGKAAQAGLQALKNLTEKKSVVQNSGVSQQEVFLIPAEGVVYKRSSEKAKEEEHLVNELFGLTSKQAVVGTFDIQSTETVKFGLQVSEETRARGFTPESLSGSPELKARITEKLSGVDRKVLLKQESTPQQEDRAKEGYEFFQKVDFQLEVPGEEPKTVSFRELQRLNLAHQLPPDARITSPTGESSTIHDLLVDDVAFASALHYFPMIHGSARTLYLCPKLNNPEEKAAYEQCEKFKWSYTNEEGDKVQTDFKTAHSLILQGQPLHGLEAVTVTSSDVAPTVDDLMIALNVQWKVVTPELMQIEGESVAPLTGVQAKPFISEMLLMKDLDAPIREAILERLTPDAEFNAILTGEFQLLDLHGGNLGVAPEPNEAYERFKNIKFTTPGLGEGEKNFNKLISEYLEGKILPETVIEFNEGDELIQLPLQDLPDLQNALDVRWKFVIFDTDMSMTENNALQIQTRRNRNFDETVFVVGEFEKDFYSLINDYYNGTLSPDTVIEFEEEGVLVQRPLKDLPDLEKAFQEPEREYLIPLRSVLLETAWKYRPLSDEVVQRLIDSDERDRRVEHWVKREDAPIYKRLSKDVKESIQQQVAPYIAKYDLSSRRGAYEETTVKSLQKEFVSELSHVDTPELNAFWYEIESDLSSVIVRQNDTWETIARRHHQSVEELFALNPGGLQPGQKARISYDLTTSSPEAAQRRASIAAQLFPRMTHRQEEALFERQHSRSEYLSSYQTLAQSTLEGEELIAQMKEFVQKPETPLNSRMKKQLFEMLDKEQKLFEDPSELLVVKQTLCEWCRPSYFNMMKAMYPLLADAYELNQLHYDNDDAAAGEAIGFYRAPLNEVVAADRWAAPENAFENQLAEDLWKRMEDVEKPAFFGHF